MRRLAICCFSWFNVAVDKGLNIRDVTTAVLDLPANRFNVLLGKMMARAKETLNERQRKHLSSRLRPARKTRKQAFGLNEEQKPLLELMIQMRRDGASIRQISEACQLSGVKIHRRGFSGSWNPGTVLRILRRNGIE